MIDNVLRHVAAEESKGGDYDNSEDQVHHQTRDQTDEGSTCSEVQCDRPPRQERKYHVQKHKHNTDTYTYTYTYTYTCTYICMYTYIPIQQEGKGCSHQDGEALVPEEEDEDEEDDEDDEEEDEEEEYCNFAALSFLACLV